MPARPASAVVALALAGSVASCGSGGLDVDGACLRLSQASSILIIAQGAIAARTATPSSTLQFYGDLQDDLDDATTLLPAGPSRDQVRVASAAMAGARSSVSRGTTDPAALATARSGIDAANLMCAGHLR